MEKKEKESNFLSYFLDVFNDSDNDERHLFLSSWYS